MYHAIRLIAAVLFGALPSLVTARSAAADTTIQLLSNRVGITVEGVDDNIVCTLHGTNVLRVDFGEQGEIELTDMLVQGANKITCTVIDHDAGDCYSYDYKIWTSRGAGFRSPIFASATSCCDSSCTRRGNPVLRETVWVNKP